MTPLHQTLLDKHVAELECPLATTDWQQHPIQEMFDAAVASMPQVTHFAAAARDVCIRMAFPRYISRSCRPLNMVIHWATKPSILTKAC